MSPPLLCAKRKEEVGLPADLPKVVGFLPTHETVTSFSVTPVVAIIRQGGFDPVPEPGEVDEIFSVPLAHVLNPCELCDRVAPLAGDNDGSISPCPMAPITSGARQPAYCGGLQHG